MTTAIVGGFLLSYESDTPGTWVHVTQIGDMNGPSEVTEEVDITNQDSDGGFKEIAPTLQDGGTITFDLIGNPADAGQVAFAAIKHARTVKAWKIVFPEDADGVVYGIFFDGFINALGNTFPAWKDVWRRSSGIRVTGPIVQDIISS